MIDRFWSKVSYEPTSGCWLWIGYVTKNGYGRFFWRGRAEWAHRAAYEMAVGPIPTGLTIDHGCRVRSCVNPSYLEVVTIGENVRRGESVFAQNKRRTHCPVGHPYTTENTRHWHGQRKCRACNREHVRSRAPMRALQRWAAALREGREDGWRKGGRPPFWSKVS
jgi:hypothetical protein